jgi:LysR family transcriptional regulator, benzoate and cis,cis-muconate-responsive activator of ben and cat genes
VNQQLSVVTLTGPGVVVAQSAEEIADLFVRESKGVTLTAAGRCFLEGAKKTLETAGSSVELARSVAEREANVLRIGFCSYAMNLGLSDAIASFRAHYPEVQIVLDDLPASEQ